jgi:hypothetical protein
VSIIQLAGEHAHLREVGRHVAVADEARPDLADQHAPHLRLRSAARLLRRALELEQTLAERYEVLHEVAERARMRCGEQREEERARLAARGAVRRLEVQRQACEEDVRADHGERSAEHAVCGLLVLERARRAERGDLVHERAEQDLGGGWPVWRRPRAEPREERGDHREQLRDRGRKAELAERTRGLEDDLA